VWNFSEAVAEWKGEIVFPRQIVPGPAPHSYGVEVARLAGVPEPVVARARTLLAGLETGQGPVGRGPQPPAAQLSLFAAGEERIRRELAAVDPERLTPLEALAVLARLVEMGAGMRRRCWIGALRGPAEGGQSPLRGRRRLVT